MAESRNFHIFNIAFEFSATSKMASRIHADIVRLIERNGISNAVIKHEETTEIEIPEKSTD